jgi:molybdopterin/thiamine biosynthesis adenylyltransferase
MIEVKNDRYSRFELISWWDQNTLKNAKIFVAGCGALGNEIVKNLVMLGAGKIYVVDMDTVEESNLTRSIFFRKEDKGKSKAAVIAKRAKEINDDVEVKFYNGNIFDLGLGIFKEFDIVIGGLDNREARLFINQSCWKTNKPWIDGAIEVLTGVARMFIPPGGTCYECTMNEQDYKLLNKRKSCLMLGIEDIIEGKIPTTPTIASIIAAMQVQEAIKYLHSRQGENDLLLLKNKGFIFNGSTNDSYIIEYPANEDCPSHYTFDNIKKIDIPFDKVTVEDIFEYGKNYFLNGNFDLEFNNEIAYREEGSKLYIIGNLNLLSVNDLKDDKNELIDFKTFHSIRPGTELFQRIKTSRLTDLKIPVNDIIILRDGDKEVQLEFNNKEIFSD